MIDTGLMAKIRKLASLAERAGTIHEAAVAQSKLTELLLRHNLTLMEVDTQELRDKYTVTRVDIGGRHNWRRDLYHTIANHHFCRSIYYPNTSYTKLLGTPENVEAVKFMYDRLSAEFVRLCEEAWKTADKEETVQLHYRQWNPVTRSYDEWYGQETRKVHGRRWKNSFMYGARRTIHDKLEAMRDTVVNDDYSNALVLDEEDALKRAVGELIGKTEKTNKRTTYNPDAYGAGKKAAQGINFNQSVNNSGTLALGRGR